MTSSARTHTENAPRDCGECGVCCTAMQVTPLNKPAGTPCIHSGADGCSIYTQRPDACRQWFCMWVRDAGKVFAESDRPDQLGVFFTASAPDPKTGKQIIYAHEASPDAIRSAPAHQLILRLARAAPVQLIGYRPPQPMPTKLTHNGSAVSSQSNGQHLAA